MAKRKSKKSSISLVILLVSVLLSVLAICTLFMPMLKTVSTTFGGASLTGAEIIEVAFASEANSDMTLQQISLLTMKQSDDNGFVAIVYCWAYFIGIIAAGVVVVFAVLKLIGIKLDILGVIGGAALVVLALIVFIFSFIVAGKFALEWTAAVGSYLAFAAILGGATAVYGAKK